MAIPKEILLRHKKIAAEIIEHDRRYYEENSPSISDAEYDALLRELEEIESGYPELTASGSPSSTVAGRADAAFGEVRHDPPMLSLGKALDEAEFFNFHRNCSETAGEGVVYVAQLKYDGLAVELEYRDGIFFRGSTRGDGVTGEDITKNVMTLRSVPKKIPGNNVPRYLSVRGEVYLNHDEFERINREKEAAGEKLFANPRNAASGSLRQLDASVTGSRNLDMVIYGYGKIDPDPGIASDAALSGYLAGLGFPVAAVTLSGNAEDVASFYRHWNEYRYTLNHDIDGIVVKLDDLSLRSVLGETARAPRWAIAWKFPAAQAVTVLHSVEYQLGRTGVLTPVANLKTVNIGGVMVKRATLHNFDEIARLNVAPTDVVSVIRAGDVIPKIVGVVERPGGANRVPVEQPQFCPSCRERLAREDVFIRCLNPACPEVILEKLKFFVSKDGLDIEFFGPELMARLVASGTVMGPADIFRLTFDDLIGLERMGEKLALKILESIKKRKHISLGHFLRCLGIRNVGQHIAQVVARELVTLDAVRAVGVDDLASIHEVGPETAAALYSFFHEPATAALVQEMLEHGLVVEDEAAAAMDDLKGLTFVFTGTLATMKREEAEALVESRGARASGSVSSKTSWVVAGEASGSKADRARTLGVPVITEDEFLKMIGRSN